VSRVKDLGQESVTERLWLIDPWLTVQGRGRRGPRPASGTGALRAEMWWTHAYRPRPHGSAVAAFDLAVV